MLAKDSSCTSGSVGKELSPGKAGFVAFSWRAGCDVSRRELRVRPVLSGTCVKSTGECQGDRARHRGQLAFQSPNDEDAGVYLCVVPVWEHVRGLCRRNRTIEATDQPRRTTESEVKLEAGKRWEGPGCAPGKVGRAIFKSVGPMMEEAWTS